MKNEKTNYSFYDEGGILRLPVVEAKEIKNEKYYKVRLGSEFRLVKANDNYDYVPKEIFCLRNAQNEFGECFYKQVVIHKNNTTNSRTNTVEQPPLEQKSSFSQSSAVRSFYNKYSLPSVLKKDRNIPVSDDNRKLEKGTLSDYFWKNQQDDLKKWFFSTGGFSRRIDILLFLATQLAEYHAMNMVYKELDPNNIKIEGCKNKIRVVLPKTNHFRSDFGNLFICPNYTAPEVSKRQLPNTPMSDCYSFALIACELLTFSHFNGAIENFDYITPEIEKLFNKTFYDGEINSINRPPMYKWVDKLKLAQSHIRKCHYCKCDFVFSNIKKSCPNCHKELKFQVAVTINRIDKKYDLETNKFSENENELYEDPIEVFYLNKFNNLLVNSEFFLEKGEPEELLSIGIKTDNDSILVSLTPLNGKSLFFYTLKENKELSEININTQILLSKTNPQKIILSLKPLNEKQRVLIIQLNKDIAHATY